MKMESIDMASAIRTAYELKLDEIRIYATHDPISEAISGPGRLVRVDSAADQPRQMIYSEHEVELKRVRLDPRLVAFNDFDPYLIAPYNRLVISLISAAASRKLKRVLIALAQYGDGRTTVTLNLAAALARATARASCRK
jgi:Mrp family chromosome partitioning ATPase